MGKIGRFFKFAAKWAAIAVAIYVASTLFSGLDFETRLFLMLFGLGMAIAYVDGKQKDRIANLEYRVREIERRQTGDVRQYPFD